MGAYQYARYKKLKPANAPGYEIYRKRNAGGVQLERETLHVMDDER